MRTTAVKPRPPQGKTGTAVPWSVIKAKLTKRRVKMPRYAVRAYGRQMWIGRNEGDAERLIGEYARLGIDARKVPISG